ncbi:MAG: DHA2 family efflux MFS transporter permease subunit [Burkholderiaceae bacterium]|nr:DHA2 family efflux MFS transporter permease subunit [Burkholderiaceae bacterium]
MSSIDEYLARYGRGYRWIATGTALVAAISVILSSTIINVAIPEVMGAFGIDQTKAQWLSTGFLAAMTATMLLTDWADRAFGQRGTVMLSLALFTAGSVLGGIAPDENVLILARVIQGAAAGVVQPLAMVIIFRVFPPHERGTAMDIFGIGVVLAPALGPWVGGLLMDAFDWRYVFYLVIPFALAGIALAAFFLPAREATGPRPGFDWVGCGLLGVFLTAILSALSSGQRAGWESDQVLAEFAVAAVAIVSFVWWEWRTAKPMLDLRLFANGPFLAASAVSFVLGAGLFGTTYLLPVFVQTIQGMTPTESGLLLMPSGFAMVLLFPLAGRLSDRVAPGVLIGGGLLLFAWSSWLTAGVDVNTGFWLLAWWTVISRIGMSFIFPALSVGSLRVLPGTLMAQGSGAINFMRQLGGAFGVNLLAVMLERRTMFHADAFAATQTPDNGTTAAFIAGVSELAANAGLPPFQQAPAALWFLGQSVYLQASTLAYRDCFLVTAFVFVAALLPTWLMGRTASPLGSGRAAGPRGPTPRGSIASRRA